MFLQLRAPIGWLFLGLAHFRIHQPECQGFVTHNRLAIVKSNEGGSYLNSRVSCVSKSNHSILCIRIYVYIYIYICITWLVEPPLKNLLAKLDHPVLKFPSLISVAMHIISPQQPPLQSSSSQAFCKRMCLIVRLRIRNHLKGKKNSRKMNCCKEAENVQGKGTWNYSGKQTSTDYQTQFGQVPCCYLSKGVLTLDLDLYFT